MSTWFCNFILDHNKKQDEQLFYAICSFQGFPEGDSGDKKKKKKKTCLPMQKTWEM